RNGSIPSGNPAQKISSSPPRSVSEPLMGNSLNRRQASAQPDLHPAEKSINFSKQIRCQIRHGVL
ncbi:hypothetical protein KDL45_09630, partial [bacterium]|nr:hypothetical protein [bacterium]